MAEGTGLDRGVDALARMKALLARVQDLGDALDDPARVGDAARTVDEAVAANRSPPDDVRNFATWTFRLCPESLLRHLFDAIGANLRGDQTYPLRGRG